VSGISESGRRLYALLPATYRARDNSLRDANGKIVEPGDQARYLNACGRLLDLIRATLDQRLKDCHPDSCQDWLLPYFADLLDVRLVSPDADGQREEIAHAVSWRKGKGTLTVAEAVAEAVGRIDVELQEGWKRLAITPRIDMPLLPATALGAQEDIDTGHACAREISEHPGLPAATVDVRRASQAILLSDGSNPAAKRVEHSQGNYWWLQANHHGIPCFPGSFDDVSRRTPDIRNADWRQGHYHPKRLLIYFPSPAGFFPVDVLGLAWNNRSAAQYAGMFEEVEEDGILVFRNTSGRALRIQGSISLEEDRTYRFEGVQLNHQLTVTQGRLELHRVAARNIVVQTTDASGVPVLKAEDCLFKSITVTDGLARMEYCTVLDAMACKYLQASDCLFAGYVAQPDKPNVPLGSSPPFVNCVRYSRVPTALLGGVAGIRTCTDAKPVFFSRDYANPLVERGCGALHPASPEAIRFGAEDGGEMGAYHHRFYCLAQVAICDKLKDYLPVGIEPVMIPDARLGLLQTQAVALSASGESTDSGGTG